MNWKGKKVFVTGAGGFVGSHLTEKLVQEGAEVRAFIHYNSMGLCGWLDHSEYKKEIEIIAGDIRDKESMVEAIQDCDIIYHLAALIAIPYSYRAPLSYIHTNIEGTLNIMTLARDINIERVVHTSTSEVYGTARYTPIDEKHPLQGQSPYSASKIGADKIAEAFSLAFEVPVVTIRPFNIFGPRQSARAIIPTIITQCINGNVIHLGNLTPTRDLSYVNNTVKGYLLAGLMPNIERSVINLGSGKEISIGNLANLIKGLFDKEIEIKKEEKRFRPEGSEVRQLIADNKLAKELLGWVPEIDLKTGLELTIEWLRNNINLYNSEIYNI